MIDVSDVGEAERIQGDGSEALVGLGVARLITGVDLVMISTFAM